MTGRDFSRLLRQRICEADVRIPVNQITVRLEYPVQIRRRDRASRNVPMPSNTLELLPALKKFGLDDFRPGQKEVIESIVAGHDCMCVMPTGGGKSLCFQLPSIIRPGLTIVVSPLIALMKDQVDGLARRGISAALINSTLSQGEQNERLNEVASGKYQMVYVAPERLRNSRFIEAIRATPIQLLAIDEAHCISQWGHDFRPDYTRIGQFRELLGGVQTVALTATATPRVREDIVSVLRLKKPKQFMSGFARPNLHFGVLQQQNDREKEDALEKFLSSVQGSGIIYSATRKRCDALVDMISQKLKIKVGAYHAGLGPDQRRGIQERFMRNDLRIIVATNAFGMGIDKSDLRFVIHFNMPGSLEAYYQEAGRAGRDNKQSQCVMLYSFQDRHIQEFFIDNSYPERELIEKVYDFLLAREEDPIELTLEQIRDALGLSISPEAIGSCLQVLGQTSVLDRLEMGGGLAMLRLDSQLPTLVDLLPREAKVQRNVLRMLEKTVGDRRGEHVYVHPRWLLQQSGLAKDSLLRAMRQLTKLDEVDYVPPFRGRAVHFRRRDVAFGDLGIDFDNLRKRKEAEYDRLNQVVDYAQSTICRQAKILQYFGDTAADDCQQCDRCGRSPGWPKFAPVASEAELPDSETKPDSSSLAQPAESRAPQGSVQNTASVDAAGGHSPQHVRLLSKVLDSIQRIHGRLGKHLLSQYLCGSQNAKVQKLNLHRLSGFGMLEGFRLTDGAQLLDLMLAAGLLRQQETNRNRPTVSVAPEWSNVNNQAALLEHIQLPPELKSKFDRLARRSQANTKPTAEARSGAATIARPTGHHLGQSPQNLGQSPLASATSQTANADTLELRNASAPNQQSLNQAKGSASRPSSPPETASSPPAVEADDFKWTLQLFSQEYNWQEVMRIRRMSDEELSASLTKALQAGAPIERSWLATQNDEPKSTGQSRVIREMQRRAAAGV